MPIAVGTRVAPPDVEVPTRPPGTPLRPSRWNDWPTVTWVAPDGVRWLLTDPRPIGRGGPGWFIPSPGPTGLGVTPRTLVTQKRERGGVHVMRAGVDERTITVPIYIEGPNHSAFLDRWRGLADAFAQTSELGPGRLIFSRPDGTRREIQGWLSSGFENDPERGITWDVATPSLLCPAGNFRDPTPIPIARRGAAGGRRYTKRFPRVSSSQTLGASIAYNPGTGAAWPVWKITGPAGAVTATNSTRGESWVIDFQAYLGAPLGAGLVATVNTETGEITGPVAGPEGTDWAGAIDWTTSVLWPLNRGANEVTFNVTGDGAATAIDASFYADYHTP
jgi:hypothetical protein